MYVSNSKDLRVAVVPSYQEELSSKAEHNFYWEYSVFVENNSNDLMQVVGRSWQIICSDGKTHEIESNNIADEETFLKPGEVFEHIGVANLNTSSGIIKGKYKMLSKGKLFDVEIPPFSLDNPYEIVHIN